jgi:3-oxoacyl-[acyl-carrier protein] reductase
VDLGLKGRTALVTGAGGGLGRAIATALTAEGANVAACDISAEALAATAEALPGANLRTYAFDLADPGALANAVGSATREFGPIDILVGITGGPPPTPATDATAAEWESHFSSLVSPVLNLVGHVLPGMRERGFGRVIVSTSSGVVNPIPNLAISNGLRLSLVGWAKTLAREVGRDGVTVNTVVPGRIQTGRILALDRAKAERDGVTPEEVAQASTASIPVGRYGYPEEFAAMVAFLAGTQASYVTGSQVRVDGGVIPSI